MRWLARFVPQVLKSDTGGANQVATFVVAPSVPREVQVDVAFTHYSLLRTTEQLLGRFYLGAAKKATSLIQLFGL